MVVPRPALQVKEKRRIPLLPERVVVAIGGIRPQKVRYLSQVLWSVTNRPRPKIRLVCRAYYGYPLFAKAHEIKVEHAF